MDCTRFGNKLTYYREKNDLTERELARKLHITVRNLEKLEMSEKEPSPMLISRISNLFGVDFRKYLDMDEKHGGAHHFDLDDPEYSPLQAAEKKSIPKQPRQRTRAYRKPADSDAIRKLMSKVMMALAILLFVFAQDIIEDLFDSSLISFLTIPLAFLLFIGSIALGRRR